MSNDERARRGFIFGLIGFGLAMLLLVVPYFSNIGAFQPIPYRVTKTEWAVKDGYIEAKVTFWKDQCRFERMIARGVFFDEVDPRLIHIADMDAEMGDRLIGLETVRLKIGPLRADYETVEVRTRHDCDGQKVDRIFLRMHLHG